MSWTQLETYRVLDTLLVPCIIVDVDRDRFQRRGLLGQGVEEVVVLPKTIEKTKKASISDASIALWTGRMEGTYDSRS
jgi:hypothetical protein